jgi:tetratricopeptide (TPR) repeat protein
MVLNHAGVVEAQAERHTEALRCFQEAARIDRYDPWPHFHAGSVLCFEGRYADAIAAFDRVEALAPGFFHVRTDRWIAQQLATGRLTQQTFRIARYLLDNEPEPEDAASSALEALRTAPIAPLYLLAGDALRKLGKTRDAEKQYRLGLEVSEEPDVRTRLLLALSVVSENRDEGRELLRNAMELRGNLTAAAMAELALRSGQLDA